MKTTLINNKKTEYSIVIPATNSPVEMTAATELKEYIKKAFGVELCIKSEDGKIHKAFYVGHTNYASFAQVKGNAKENWIIKMHDDNLILTGGIKNTDRGILYAVYHFLEDVVGIRWWNYWEEYIPQNEILVLDSDYEKSGTPAFPYRRILHCVTTTDFYYDVRTRCNVISGDDNLDGGVFQKDIASLGGAIYMGKPHHVHTLDKYFPRDEYFEKTVDMLETYFKNGGVHFQLTYVSKEDLINAKVTPEDYKNLRVRVTGFSDYFVKLNEAIQDDIIERTTQK